MYHICTKSSYNHVKNITFKIFFLFIFSSLTHIWIEKYDQAGHALSFPYTHMEKSFDQGHIIKLDMH